MGARGGWWNTGTRAETPLISKQCFALMYDNFSVVSWLCPYFSLNVSHPRVLVLSGKQTHSHEDGLALQGCLCFESLQCSSEMFAEGHPQLKVIGSQRQPELPGSLYTNFRFSLCKSKQDLKLNWMFLWQFNIENFKFSINWDYYILCSLFNGP